MGVKGNPNSTEPRMGDKSSQTPNPAKEQTETPLKVALYSDAESAARNANANASPRLQSDNPSLGNAVAESATPSTRPRSSQSATDGPDNEHHPLITVAKTFFGLNRSAPAPTDSHHKRQVLQKHDRTSLRDEDQENEAEKSFVEMEKEFWKLEDKIKRLKEDNRVLKADYELANNEFIKFNGEIWRLKQENTKLKAERDTEANKARNKLQKAKDTSQKEMKQREDDLRAKLNAEKEKLTSKFESERSHLEREKANLLYQIQQLEARCNTSSINYDVLLKTSQRDIAIRDNEIKKCREDNQSLRRYIDNMRNAQEPLRGEEKYTQKFEDLNNKITSWVLKQSKQHANTALKDSKVRTAVLTKLESFGVHGQHTATCVRSSFPQLYNSKKTRAPLIRHILALFLFDRVFYPFAFALKPTDSKLSHDSSHYLTFIEDELFEQGQPIILYKD